MSRIRQNIRFHTQGKCKKEISQLTSSSRNTVKKYIRKFIGEHLTYEQITQMSDHQLELLFGYIEPSQKDKRFDELQALLPELEKRLKQKGMTLQLLWQQYRKDYPPVTTLLSFTSTTVSMPAARSL